MTQWVTDEVWEQLDPHAGTLTRNQRKRLGTVAVAAGLVLAAAFAIDRSGIVRAHVEYSADTSFEGAATVNPKIFTRQIAVKNTGWTTVRVLGIGSDGPGLRLLAPAEVDAQSKTTGITQTRLPLALHPGQTVMMAVAYQVTDCNAVPAGSYPVPVRVDAPWETQTIDISLPARWLKDMADQACHPGR